MDITQKELTEMKTAFTEMEQEIKEQVRIRIITFMHSRGLAILTSFASYVLLLY